MHAGRYLAGLIINPPRRSSPEPRPMPRSRPQALWATKHDGVGPSAGEFGAARMYRSRKLPTRWGERGLNFSAIAASIAWGSGRPDNRGRTPPPVRSPARGKDGRLLAPMVSITSFGTSVEAGSRRGARTRRTKGHEEAPIPRCAKKAMQSLTSSSRELRSPRGRQRYQAAHEAPRRRRGEGICKSPNRARGRRLRFDLVDEQDYRLASYANCSSHGFCRANADRWWPRAQSQICASRFNGFRSG